MQPYQGQLVRGPFPRGAPHIPPMVRLALIVARPHHALVTAVSPPTGFRTRRRVLDRRSELICHSAPTAVGRMWPSSDGLRTPRGLRNERQAALSTAAES